MHPVLKFKKQKEQLSQEPQPNCNLGWWTSMLEAAHWVQYKDDIKAHIEAKAGCRTMIVNACVLFDIPPPSVILAKPHNLWSCTLWHSSKGHTCPAGSDTALMPPSGRKKLSMKVGLDVRPQRKPDLRVLGTQFSIVVWLQAHQKCHHCRLSFPTRFSVFRQSEHAEVFLSSRTVFLNEITRWFQQSFIKHFLYVLENKLAQSLPSKSVSSL